MGFIDDMNLGGYSGDKKAEAEVCQRQEDDVRKREEMARRQRAEEEAREKADSKAPNTVSFEKFLESIDNAEVRNFYQKNGSMWSKSGNVLCMQDIEELVKMILSLAHGNNRLLAQKEVLEKNVKFSSQMGKGRRKKKIDWKKYQALKSANLSNVQIAKILGISVSTLSKRVKIELG